MEIAYHLKHFLRQYPLGYVTGEAGGCILSEQHIFNPDVGYISKARLPEIPEREVNGAPDLAVEVMSPTDRRRRMRSKAEIYLLYGSRLVWLVFPDTQVVEVYTGGELLPGFTLAVRSIFTR